MSPATTLGNLDVLPFEMRERIWAHALSDARASTSLLQASRQINSEIKAILDLPRRTLHIRAGEHPGYVSKFPPMQLMHPFRPSVTIFQPCGPGVGCMTQQHQQYCACAPRSTFDLARVPRVEIEVTACESRPAAEAATIHITDLMELSYFKVTDRKAEVQVDVKIVCSDTPAQPARPVEADLWCLAEGEGNPTTKSLAGYVAPVLCSFSKLLEGETPQDTASAIAHIDLVCNKPFARAVQESKLPGCTKLRDGMWRIASPGTERDYWRWYDLVCTYDRT